MAAERTPPARARSAGGNTRICKALTGTSAQVASSTQASNKANSTGRALWMDAKASASSAAP